MKISRAQGSLLGQFAGDSLGSLVEFQNPEEIRRAYPEGVRKLADCPSWGTIAGQPTDDSEMALMLARMLLEHGTYDSEAAFRAYLFWFESGPFDCGRTIADALNGRPNPDSQANGAMMRIAPLGIFGSSYPSGLVVEWAEQDAALTHPNPVCKKANALFAAAIARAVRTGEGPEELYQSIVKQAVKMVVPTALLEAVRGAADGPPENYIRSQGWVLTAFRNALWQLLHAPTFEAAVVDTIMHGGDTDTNAAICGALLGAVYGREAVPAQWTETLLACKPAPGTPGVHRPRPECFWPGELLEIAKNLVTKR